MKVLTVLLMLCLTIFPVAAQQVTVFQAAAWSQDGKLLLTIGPNRHLRLHDGTTGEVIKSVTVPGSATTYESLGPDSGTEVENVLWGVEVSGGLAVSADYDDNFHWWSVPTLEQLGTSRSNYGIVGFNLGGDVVAYTGTSSRYLDSEISWSRLGPEEIEGALLPDLPPPDSNYSYGVPGVSPDGHWVMANTDEGVRLWNLSGPEVTSVLLTQSVVAQERSLGRERYYCLSDGEVLGYRYDAPQSEPLRLNAGPANHLFVTSDETRLFLQGVTGLKVYDLKSGDLIQTWERENEPLLHLSPDGSRGFTVTENWLECWDIPSQTRLYRLAIAPDSDRAAERDARCTGSFG